MTEALMRNHGTIGNHHKRDAKGDLCFLITHDSEAFRNNETLVQRPLRNIYLSGNERMCRAKQTWRMAMDQLLHHLLHKKAKLIESKANTEKQSFQWITIKESMNTRRGKVHLFCVRYSASQGE
jgi:hypothetical protein